MVDFRTLRAHEREAWLELLDAWPLPDAARGREFFARPVRHDPGFEDRNVWVAQADGRLVSSVQIFPLRLRLAGEAVPTGGIGSVFTAEPGRGRGLASQLLERAAQDLRERGFELSLLLARRLAFYGRLGWRSWPVRRALLRRDPAAPLEASDACAEPFAPERDLDAVRALHEAYSGARDGTAVRDAVGWRTSLALAGNPGEEFLVARRGGAVRAYARAAVLDGLLCLLEFGRAPDAADALAALIASLLAPRTGDPLATREKPSAALRALVVAPDAWDALLARALEGLGVSATAVDDPTAMLRVIDSSALARRLGEPPDVDPERLLQRRLPPERFLFWPADRF